MKKSSKPSPSSTEEEDDTEENFIPTSRDENAKEMGYSSYVPPPPTPDTSEADAKKEVCKTLYKYHGSQLSSPREVEKILLDVNSKMDENDRKIGQKFDWDFTKKTEAIAAKFQKKAFLYIPKQDKFEETLMRVRDWFFFANWNMSLPHKTNGEIDWKESLKYLAKKNQWSYGRGKSQAEKDYQNLKEEIETKVNAFFMLHAKKFPELTNLKELNQWVNMEAQKRELATSLKWQRAKAAKKIGKESWHAEVVPPDSMSKTIFKNEKFNITYKLNIYVVRDEKF